MDGELTLLTFGLVKIKTWFKLKDLPTDLETNW